jgi:hypothetical protein
MSKCVSVISHARFNRHNIDPKTMICKRCLQPAFVKPKKQQVFTYAVFPEQVETAEEILMVGANQATNVILTPAPPTEHRLRLIDDVPEIV